MAAPAPRSPSSLAGPDLELVVEARRAVLVTIDPAGFPRPPPCCYVAAWNADGSFVLRSPIDEKPKRTADPQRLARVADIGRRPEVAVLVDRWDEDWTRLAWIRLRGIAVLLGAGDPATLDERTTAIAALRAKYAQYATQGLETRALIRIVIESWSGWTARSLVRS
jgi:PPOX class probable F420-dependent enzyme